MLSNTQISQIKGYLAQGYKQHEVAAHFGVNGGRVAEVATGKLGGAIAQASASELPPMKQQPLFFTPKQTLDEQKEIFARLVATARTNGPAHVHLITPELAEWLLKNRHGGNRRPSARSIENYAEAMEENDWPVTGATIVVGRSGNILDGQHRLMGCIRSGQAFMTYIVFGIDDSTFTRIDTGRKRTNIDAFQIDGIAHPSTSAKAARWLRIQMENPEDRGVTFTNDELLSWLKGKAVDRKLFEECVSYAIALKKDSKLLKCELPDGQMAALFYLFAKKSKPDMIKFVALLRAGNKQPAISLYASINQARLSSGGRIHEVLRNGRVIQAWNAFRDGRRASANTLNYTPERHDYPEIV